MKEKRVDFPGKDKRRMRLYSEAATEFFGLNMTENSDFDTLVTGDGSFAVTPRPSEDPSAEFVGLYEPDSLNVDTEYSNGVPESTDGLCNKKMRENKSDMIDKHGKNVANAYSETGQATDPFGSWTGHPHDDLCDVPVQDADDL